MFKVIANQQQILFESEEEAQVHEMAALFASLPSRAGQEIEVWEVETDVQGAQPQGAQKAGAETQATPDASNPGMLGVQP